MSVLEAKSITKTFPGVKALENVDISFELGKIHCIVGENGAGKSTLIKCLTGNYEPDSGEILIGGSSAKNDRKLFQRIAYVPQEIDLFQYMTVAENLFIPFERAGIKGRIRHRRLEEKAAPILEKFHITAKGSDIVKDISVSEQQLLQIARAVSLEEYDVLILDEPTTCLTTKEAQQLFEIVNSIKAENKAIIFISHKLDEVFELGDTISVFVNGLKVATEPLSDVDINWVVEQMTGKVIDYQEMFHSGNVTEETILEVENLSGKDFHHISFQLKKGEILGFSGLVGAGRSELMQAIFGYLPVYEGNISSRGKKWKKNDTHASVANGMFYLPEERRSQGILPELSVSVNASMNSLNRLNRWNGISRTKEKALVTEIVEEYNIKTSDFDKEIKFLSGGNQQKVIVGRCTSSDPEILVFDEPTKGIDIGAKTDIYKLMKRLAEQGIGIILISSEMDEIRKCSNRIICMYQGSMTGEFDGNANKDTILKAILGIGQETKEEDHNAG
ncbi:MAG: sugar ABC transporter ATP-binding protein [Parasporobacterium sp.]|nr:sugar ABC transporter ATP-binding protein [Parasporobacterium sp.]